MPKRNLENPPKERLQPVDSLGRLRIYFDVDRRLTVGLTMLASMRHITRRQLVEELFRDAIMAEPAAAMAAGLITTPRVVSPTTTVTTQKPPTARPVKTTVR